MKTTITLCILLISFSLNSVSQDCSGGRYATELFPTNILTSDILYGNNISLNGSSVDLYLDVYEPAGDTETSRPLIIMAHGGSFIGGDKADGCTDNVCIALTKLGYVTASINYRTGMGFPINEQSATQAVYRATHDARAAVRFFRKDFVLNGNTYGIDTSQIYFGGQSAGAFVAIHLAYMNDTSEMPLVIDTTLAGMGGGVEGNSGNPGYSSDVNAIISYSGALVDTAFIGADDTPIISFHGDADGTVPYGSALIYVLGFPLMEVDGSESIAMRMNNLGIVNCFKPYPGQDHVPECISASYFDTSITYVRNWMLQFVCGPVADCAYDLDTSLRVTATASPTSATPCNGMATASAVNGTEPYNFMWSDPSGTASAAVSDLCAGNYTVTVTDAAGGTSTTTIIVEDATGIFEDERQLSFSIYPNPAGTSATVSLENGSLINAQLELYDAFGRMVRREYTQHQDELIIQKGELPSGLYFVKVFGEQGQFTSKLIFE